ncbi:MAG: HAMP domain-containing histidine kinase [Bacteroidetes bacterium]|nr:HAMP domain-containing histidine kinase [Bacteroidota bacterium]
MKIRRKIILYFSSTTIVLVGLSFLFIYTLFSNFRQEEFDQRLREKTITTLKFLIEIQEIDHDLLQTMDKYTINSLYNEKVLLFDEHQKPIYSSLDDTQITYPDSILQLLSPANPIIVATEDRFQVVAMYFQIDNKKYYGITKAYDTFGITKLNYLRTILFTAFLIITVAVLLITYFISKQLSQPINRMASEITKINIDSADSFISVPSSKDEINLLALRFNELMKRLNDSFSFQKHAVHHISHELKTPIAILVSNFERMEKETDIEILKSQLINQKEDTKTLSDIINALLEISKTESGNTLSFEKVRIDDLIFDIIDEVKKLQPEYEFMVDISGNLDDESTLIIPVNNRLLTSALMNLATNSMYYSETNTSKITIIPTDTTIRIEFQNHGKNISQAEQEYLFQHFFRGENSKGKRGFGLGLVLVSRIIELHHGQIHYQTPEPGNNLFIVELPKSILS